MRVRTQQLVALGLADEEPGDRPVAEVEHEARALVPVVEQVRLAARGDHQHAAQLVFGADQSRAIRSATDVPCETLSYSTAKAFTQPSRCAIHGDACQTEKSFQVEP